MKRIVPSLLFAVMLCGCATQHYMTDAKHPEVAIRSDGSVTYRDKIVDPDDLPGLLRDSGFTRNDTINIHFPDNETDFRTASQVMTILLRNGYPRSVLVGDRKSYSHAGPDKRKKPQGRQAQPPQEKPRVRYK